MIDALRTRVRARLGASGPFARAVVLLSGGAALGQALAILALPLVSRLYTPADLGIFGAAWAFASLFSVASALRYELMIPQAADDAEASDLLLLAVLSSAATAVLGGVLFAVGIGARRFGLDALPGWAPLVLAPSLAILGVGAAVRFWLIRAEAYRPLSALMVRQGVWRLAVTLGAGVARTGWVGLLAGEAVGRLAGLGAPLRVATARWRGLGWAHLWPRVRAAAARFRRAPTVLLPSALLDAAGQALVVPLAFELYGPAAAGTLVLSQRILAAPAALVGASVADVFHGTVSGHAREAPGRIRAVFLATTRHLALLGLATLVPLAVAAPFVFPPLFGPSWRDAGLLTAASVPWAFSALVVSPVSRLLLVVRREHWKLYYDVLAVLFLVAGLTAGARAGLSFPLAMLVMSLLQALAYGVFLLLMLRALRAVEASGPVDVEAGA